MKTHLSSALQLEDKLRECNERFHQVTVGIDQVFWMATREGKQIFYISPGFERIWGRTCQSLYDSPLSWLDGINLEDRQRVDAAALNRQTTGEYNVEYRITRPDGTERWIHDRVFPIRETPENVHRIAGIAEDITERKRLEYEVLKISSHELQRIGNELHDDICR